MEEYTFEDFKYTREEIICIIAVLAHDIRGSWWRNVGERLENMETLAKLINDQNLLQEIKEIGPYCYEDGRSMRILSIYDNDDFYKLCKPDEKKWSNLEDLFEHPPSPYPQIKY